MGPLTACGQTAVYMNMKKQIPPVMALLCRHLMMRLASSLSTEEYLFFNGAGRGGSSAHGLKVIL